MQVQDQSCTSAEMRIQILFTYLWQKQRRYKEQYVFRWCAYTTFVNVALEKGDPSTTKIQVFWCLWQHLFQKNEKNIGQGARNHLKMGVCFPDSLWKALLHLACDRHALIASGSSENPATLQEQEIYDCMSACHLFFLGWQWDQERGDWGKQNCTKALTTPRSVSAVFSRYRNTFSRKAAYCVLQGALSTT